MEQQQSSVLLILIKSLVIIILVITFTHTYHTYPKHSSKLEQETFFSEKIPPLKSQNIENTIPAEQQKEMKQRLPCVFISHGLVGETIDPKRGQRIVFKKYFEENKLLTRVKTAIIISGHFEENAVTVNLKPNPVVVHDHPSEWLFKYNFPFETNLELAQKIKQRLEDSKFQVKTTKHEDVDHGGWGGIFHLYDIEQQQKQYNANKTQYVPQIVQVSLNSNMNMEMHYKLGQVLNEFRDENTMIICSGATTHSFTYMRHPKYKEWSEEWEKMIIGFVTSKDVKYRNQSLFKIKEQKMYNYINHSDEHFSPLLVALGTATEETPKLLHLEKDMLLYGSSYIFP